MAADGQVFACGSNVDSYGEFNGQLGVGDTDDYRLVPTLVTWQLQRKTAVYTVAGNYHTLCITADGSLFAWGSNLYGQLGVGDTEERLVPMLVTRLQGKQVVHVAAGPFHTICTTADGSVFTWGRGGDGNEESSAIDFECGQLGLGDDWSNKLEPTQVRDELLNDAVVQVAAGNNHSICVTRDSSVYTWGDNAQGQLGVGDGNDGANLPALLQVLDLNENSQSA